ncbi:TetR/AcrR family transcriptional regulator [Nocardia miyunensis]|uniref:TetR/AcrR family transcriptional regulator n=1 Tax=Nocardia miyunensis TaxID=282684 RepID=UPI00082C6847|nr:TetR/AcrR family transcriptional regulator [Nocardia miyunensis]
MTAAPVPGKPLSRGAARTRQIIVAAAKLFEDVGYQNVSIDDIGTAVGLTGPAVYRHFSGKHDILVKALESQVAAVALVVGQAAEGDPAERPLVMQLIDQLTVLTVERDEAFIWRRERRHLDSEHAESFRTTFGSLLSRIASLIGQFRPELDDGQARLLGLALLSLYGNVHDIRSHQTDARFAGLVTGAAKRIVLVDLGNDAPATELSPPPGRRRPAGRRELVIEAAADLFDKRGFYDVRIDDIARAAEMSVATLYQHFDSKSRILQAVLERGAEGLLYITTEALTVTQNAEDTLRTLIRTYVSQALGLHGRTMRILASDLHYLPTEVQDALREVQREYVAEWTAVIGELHPGLATADARALAHAAINIITDLSQTYSLRGRSSLTRDLEGLAFSVVSASAQQV